MEECQIFQGETQRRHQQMKFTRKYFNCDWVSHKSSGYKKSMKKQEDNLNKGPDIDLCTMAFEVNLVGSNIWQWWIDTCVTIYVCYNKELLHNFEKVKDEYKLFMGNSTTLDIKGQEKVILKMILGKELTLNNMLYVLEIRKNLMFGSLLSKYDFCNIF